ncbi:DegT/DnrJ/EryC1/StrS family aminotransferase [Azoarcus sp. PA01]|nr:DegT/DnrJ/EryC1/StrS family aminotransferase [Azoarcus sp. PA01]
MRPPKAFDEPVYVTRPLLPPLEEYTALLQQVWDSGWLTNGGRQHAELERELARHLGAEQLSLFNNGTIALIVACQALRLSGEVITTPFTFPATPHVLSWNNITPVFADIDPDTLCIDPARVEALVSNRTSAILGVHVYGVPCDVHALDDIARRQGLRVVYDAAHAFGTTVGDKPIAAFGDATMFSLHATKLFHSAEGGALAVSDPDLKQRIDLLKNFGIKNEDEVVMPGINGKLSELQAALGRVVLRHVDAERARRAEVRRIYEQRLQGVPGLRLHAMPAGVVDSLQYLVLRIDAVAASCDRDTLHARLKRYNIVTRKYFHPLCSDYSCYRQLPTASPRHLPVAYRIATEVLALPFHGTLAADDVHRICDAILYALRQ